MATQVLIEVVRNVVDPFEVHTSALESVNERSRQHEEMLSIAGLSGVTVDPTIAPVPMLIPPAPAPALEANTLDQLNARGRASQSGLESTAQSTAAVRAFGGRSTVIAATVEQGRIDELRSRRDIIIWPNSDLTLLGAGTAHVDCRPFRPAVDLDTIRATLGVNAAWTDGFKGGNIVVGIIDEGFNGATYPVSGGFTRPISPATPGSAQVTSHGSMCAADIKVAAPDARLYDYPFLGVPNSGGALQMFQAVLDQRLRDGTPHITNNSYGFTGVPDPATFPNHEIHDINHPVHRKVREVVAAGVACFFAAGNCGANCPSGNCQPSGTGPGRSISASNSLLEVITCAAVNNSRERIGYSSQGPGMFERQKPDIASYSHIFGNFGPDRPGGDATPFDSGTSAATPVAAGVGAMLLSAFPALTPAQLKAVLIRTAIGGGGWNAEFGNGIIDAAAAYNFLKTSPPPPMV
jgi:subtilisin family serine protease